MFPNHHYSEHNNIFESSEHMLDIVKDQSAPEFTMDEELLKLRRERSRAERQSKNSFEALLMKRAPSRDFKELMTLELEAIKVEANSEESGSSHGDEDVLGSTCESSDEKLDIIKLVMRMGEENLLRLTNFNGEFGRVEKLFISNLIYIKRGVGVDITLETEIFVDNVNKELKKAKEKRKDDRLRFIYKRAIKLMLSKCTKYLASKSFKMEDFTDEFIKHYFGKKNNHNQDVLDTSYASCKKLKQYFLQSHSFKKDFVEHALDQIFTEYVAYSIDIHSKMHKLLVEQAGNEAHSERLLFQKFKRIPWSSKDIQVSMQMIRDLVN
jgi:hypothetical protein